jgi:hypothetical protein
MPTVIEPKGNEPKPQLVTPPANERELFAAEIEMESKSSNFMPVLLIFGLIFVVGGTIFYLVKGARDVLTTPVATTTVERILETQGPATVRFSAGTVVASINEKPFDPHYRLLSKAGVITAKSKGANSVVVKVTDPGETLLGTIGGVQKQRNSDGTTSYLVPLAVRKLISVDKVTMIKPHLAQVDYTWKWEPNRLGEEFNASGSLVQSFTTWDRATLIKSYGVDFYHAAPAKASLVLMEGNNGIWKPYSE